MEDSSIDETNDETIDDEVEIDSSISGITIIDESMNEIMRDQFKSDNFRKVIIRKGEDRTTTNFMRVTEFTRVVVTRSQQIVNGAKPFVEADAYNGESLAITLAKKEILEKCCPLTIRRPLFKSPEKIIVEDWKVNELTPVRKCFENLNSIKFDKYKGEKITKMFDQM